MLAWHYSEKTLQPYISAIPELNRSRRLSPARRAMFPNENEPTLE
jgi:hypothetical protein